MHRALVWFVLLLSPVTSYGALVDAVDCLGQLTSDGRCNLTLSTPGTTDRTMQKPHSMVLDATNRRLFVTEEANCRVVVFNLDANLFPEDRIPDGVLGQTNFTSGCSGITASATSLGQPMGIVLTGNRLFVSDELFNRVMVFDVATLTNGEEAISVIGQSDFMSSGSGCSPTTLNGPDFLAVRENKLFITDIMNNRLLVHDISNITNGQSAEAVLGQSNLSSCSGAVGSDRLDEPTGLAIKGTKLFVSDRGNNRIVVFDIGTVTTGEGAENVLGQQDLSTNSAATLQAGMNEPAGLFIAGNHLYVTDEGNNRVMVWDIETVSDGESSLAVLGQADFTTSIPGTTASRLIQPLDLTGGGVYLIVADAGNNRVTYYRMITTQLEDKTISKGSCRSGVSLSASGSTSLLGGPLSYSWTQRSGDTGTLQNTTTSAATFTCSTSGTRTFAPQVSSMGFTDTSSVLRLQVTNTSPTANAGNDLSSDKGKEVSLKGSGSDGDGDTFTYSWSFVSGPETASLSQSDTAEPKLTPGTAGDYIFRLAVTDAEGTTASDTVTLSVKNTVTAEEPPPAEPAAAATPEAPAPSPETTTSDTSSGSTSSDKEGDTGAPSTAVPSSGGCQLTSRH